jgi:hypothetical protein
MQRENPIVKQVGTFTQALSDEATKKRVDSHQHEE